MKENKKVSESQSKASKKWDLKNKDRKNYIIKRSTARNFIKTMENEDIEEFTKLLEDRIKNGKKTKKI